MLKICMEDFEVWVFWGIDVIYFSCLKCFIFDEQIVGIGFALFASFKAEK